jgi:hypothetical protein
MMPIDIAEESSRDMHNAWSDEFSADLLRACCSSVFACDWRWLTEPARAIDVYVSVY